MTDYLVRPDPSGAAIHTQLFLRDSSVHVVAQTDGIRAFLRVGDDATVVTVRPLSGTIQGDLNCLEDFLTRALDAVYDLRGRLAGVTDCPVCEGSGRVQPGADPQVEVRCVRCHGDGEIPIGSLAHGEYPGGDAV